MTLVATCACCGQAGVYEMNKEEAELLTRYWEKGRSLGFIQDLFPNVPAWIRSGAIDMYSDGFCICPDCFG